MEEPDRPAAPPCPPPAAQLAALRSTIPDHHRWIRVQTTTSIIAFLDERLMPLDAVPSVPARPLDHTPFPYVYLDATYLHARNLPGKGGQVVSMFVVVAAGIAADDW